MPRESVSNIGMTCTQHAPKPGAYSDLNPESLVGKYVKKSFTTDHHSVRVEHMWVKVEEVVDGKLRGRLDNDPIFCSQLKDKDIVDVSLTEIEDVTE